MKPTICNFSHPSALLLVAAWLFTPCLHAAPGIGAFRVTPSTAVIGTPAQITVTVAIADSSLIPSSVELLQLDVSGKVIGVLGVLHDDGANGDVYAGDTVHTLVVPLSSPSAGQVQFQVSASFRGVLRRVRSPIATVSVQAADAPQQALKALANSLQAGDRTAAQNYVALSDKSFSALATFSPAALSKLASILTTAVLVKSKEDLRVFQAPFTEPNGTKTTVEFNMVPGPDGQWLINNW